MIRVDISVARVVRAYHLVLGVAVIAFAPLAGAQGSLACGPLENAYGPYDYTNPVHFRERLPVVERAHFNHNVESLRSSNRGARYPRNIGADLDYTLRAFPNHHRALHAAARFHLGKSPVGFSKMRYSIDCYFDRAMRFKPNDGVVRLIYGIYLFQSGKLEEAGRRFEEALQLSPNSAEVHYNYGLMLVKSGDLEKAKFHAEKAYELGYPMPGLRNMLERAGAW